MRVAVRNGRSRIAVELIAAYRAACYRVDAGFELSIDLPSVALAAWQNDHGVACSALITACNPASQARSALWNRSATRQLQVELVEHALACSPTLALDPDAHWPAEPGFLIAGLGRKPAEAMGRRFEQNAIVWADADAVPRLILLR